MGEQRKPSITSKDLVDMALTVLIVGVSLYPLYRDDLKRLAMRFDRWLNQKRNMEAEALKQVQKEISLMEHGEFGEAPSAD
jgi:hypothetical protein